MISKTLCIIVVLTIAIGFEKVCDKPEEDFTIYSPEKVGCVECKEEEDFEYITEDFEYKSEESDDDKLKENWYTDYEFDLICKLVMAEGGSDSIPDEAQQGIAAVVVNRTRYPEAFSDTIEGVVFQEGQYACASYLDDVKPTERVVDNVRKVLDGEVYIPEDVVWQAGFPQSAWGTDVHVYAYYDTEPYDTYLCHWGK